MKLSDFYLQVIDAFNSNKVEYMIVGGHAVNYHGYVRATVDMDIWVNKTDKNLEKLYAALLQLGYKENNCKDAIVSFKENHIIKIPRESNIIELLDSFVLNEDFEKSYSNREITEVNNTKLIILGFNELLSCKYKSNRPKDLLDVQELKRIEQLVKNKKK